MIWRNTSKYLTSRYHSFESTLIHGAFSGREILSAYFQNIWTEKNMRWSHFVLGRIVYTRIFVISSRILFFWHLRISQVEPSLRLSTQQKKYFLLFHDTMDECVMVDLLIYSLSQKMGRLYICGGTIYSASWVPLHKCIQFLKFPSVLRALLQYLWFTDAKSSKVSCLDFPI